MGRHSLPDQYGAGTADPRPRARRRTVAVTTVLVLTVAALHGDRRAGRTALLRILLSGQPKPDAQVWVPDSDVWGQQIAGATGGSGQSVSDPSQIHMVILKAIVAAGASGSRG
ncbi:hypothetical protein [Streptomyces sp. NPDC002088]|uniref:hypothetical protein n=1 Tax=Streptomyces sp. NPDC002088 TaxID=3154665 RepID=UPI0033266E3A